MQTPIRSQKVTTSKLGLNHIRSIVENAGSIFIKIDQEDDLGIDGIIELIAQGRPTHKSLAVQIKSGVSFLDRKSCCLVFPVGSHREYWSRYPLPVIGVVFDPEHAECHWFDIKAALKEQTGTTIKIPFRKYSLISKENFQSLFIPLATGSKVTLPFSEIAALAESSEPQDRRFAHEHLFRSYPLVEKTWDILFDHLAASPVGEASPRLAYYFSHIPWHGDLWGNSDYPFKGDYKELLNAKIQKLNKNEVIKLLFMIEPEEGIARGTIGQCVESIVSAISQHEAILDEIARDGSIELSVREFAAFIFAIHNSQGAIPLFEELARSGSEYAPEIIRYISESNHFNPYA